MGNSGKRKRKDQQLQDLQKEMHSLEKQKKVPTFILQGLLEPKTGVNYMHIQYQKKD